MRDLSPIPAGTLVLYRGTRAEHWGQEFIARPCGPNCGPCVDTRLQISIGLLPETADPGDRYELLDPARDLNSPGAEMHHVRRRSITAAL